MIPKNFQHFLQEGDNVRLTHGYMTNIHGNHATFNDLASWSRADDLVNHARITKHIKQPELFSHERIIKQLSPEQLKQMHQPQHQETTSLTTSFETTNKPLDPWKMHYVGQTEYGDFIEEN